jgi:hypothetical protein
MPRNTKRASCRSLPGPGDLLSQWFTRTCRSQPTRGRDRAESKSPLTSCWPRAKKAGRCKCCMVRERRLSSFCLGCRERHGRPLGQRRGTRHIHDHGQHRVVAADTAQLTAPRRRSPPTAFWRPCRWGHSPPGNELSTHGFARPGNQCLRDSLLRRGQLVIRNRR